MLPFLHLPLNHRSPLPCICICASQGAYHLGPKPPGSSDDPSSIQLENLALTGEGVKGDSALGGTGAGVWYAHTSSSYGVVEPGQKVSGNQQVNLGNGLSGSLPSSGLTQATRDDVLANFGKLAGSSGAGMVAYTMSGGTGE